MHRSGTSLVASFLSALGLDVGERLVEADRLNPRGYFEDATLVEFHQRLLREMVPAGESGWPDWGWTVSERLDEAVPRRRREEALAALASRDKTVPWGWKDPRTTLLLDFWAELLPDAVFVLVHRSPVEVLDSVLRAGNRHFVIHPDHVVRAWLLYNRRALDFTERNPDRAVLFGVGALATDARPVAARLAELAGEALPALGDPDSVRRARDDVFDAALLRERGPRDPLRLWIERRMPAALELYGTTP
jgi:hypothetical protein